MRFQVKHVTRYLYGDPVSLCHNIAHLKPRELAGQQVISNHLHIEPRPAALREHTDFFGNRVSYFCIQQSHSALEIQVVSNIDINPPRLPEFACSPPWEQVAAMLWDDRNSGSVNTRLFCLPTATVPHLEAAVAFARDSFTPGRPILEAVHDLTTRIFSEFVFDSHFTTIATPVEDVLTHRKGVCQDFAHLGLACLRGLGLAARYVSGYLETLPPPGRPKLQGADASHAWFAVFVPNAGWVDFDPTNGQIPRQQHITTALGRDYHDVTPVRGVFYGGGEHRLEVEVDVNRS
jgi:transglutaminase-like putative cysteine protease